MVRTRRCSRVTHDDVGRIALALPETHERASYGGRPSFRTSQRMFTWIREAPEALVIWVPSEDDKEAMISSAPSKFFTADHYDGGPIVLLHLDAIDVDEATELITDSWRLRVLGPRWTWESADQGDIAPVTISWHFDGRSSIVLFCRNIEGGTSTIRNAYMTVLATNG